MKTRTWICIFSAIAVICIALSLWFFCSEAKNTAQVFSDGKLLYTVDLSKDAQYRIEYNDEWNILTVKNGKICVSSASCATQDCVRHGRSNGGAPIVCLPNRLVIEFTQSDSLDAVLK